MPCLPLLKRRLPLLAMAGLAAGMPLGGCSSAPRHETPRRAESDHHALPDLLAQRLLLAREVAWSKFHSGAPVHDPEREAAILAGIVEQAAASGHDRARAERFFAAQMAASRAVQTELLAAWAAGDAPRPAHPPRDLRTEIRPRLDQLTPRLLQALPRQAEATLAEAGAAALRTAGFSAPVIALAVEPLR